MQGRLLPKYKNHYQSHPYFNWNKEFRIAKKIGLKHIEFIFDNNLPHLNPLMSENGINEINRYKKSEKILVKNICADYFMDNPFYESGYNKIENIKTIKKLIHNVSKIGVKDIILPCVDNSSINSKKKKFNLIKNIESVAGILEDNQINLSIETDLSPKRFKKLLIDADFPFLKVNYDVGNSAGLGYDINEEFDSYGPMISSIHIKDRILNGKSVFLGKGNSDFKKLFKNIQNLNYKGLYTMQIYRDFEGLNIFKKQLSVFKQILKKINV